MDTPSLNKARRNLPHWTKTGEIYWITFRLADSLPQSKLIRWKAERMSWMKSHPEPWSSQVWREYDVRFGERLEGWLDAGYGSCVLARPDCRQVVIECLFRFQDERLHIHHAVVMPNHVHLLLQPLQENQLCKLMQGIKGGSSRECNRILGKTGTFWMPESYDHIVRSEAQYGHYLRYIQENPGKAGLPVEQYWLMQP